MHKKLCNLSLIAIFSASTLIQVVNAEAPTAKPLAVHAEPPKSPATFCRFVPERMDDFAWENDLVAFRVYGPALRKTKGSEDSGIDCWLKRVKYPIIDRWYSLKNYHADEGEGHDPYHVGSSRGCGGTAIWSEGKLITAGLYKEWKIISQTPEISVFELIYHYNMGERTITETKRITIELGQRMFKSESLFSENNKPVQLEIAIGITTHDGKAEATLNPKSGWMTCWEKIGGQGLGTGVVVDSSFKVSMREEKSAIKDKSHILAIIATNAQGQTIHYAGYGWEKAGEIKSLKQWQEFLEGFTLNQKKD